MLSIHLNEVAKFTCNHSYIYIHTLYRDHRVCNSMSELLKQYIITKRESVHKTEVKKEPN